MVNRQVNYLNCWRCLGSNLLDIPFVYVFGSYVLSAGWCDQWGVHCNQKGEWKLFITFRWRWGSICWSIGIWCRCDGQSMARRALSPLGCSLSAGHLAFSASSDINKGWCVIADKRVICWWRVFDRLSTFADCWGWSTIDLLRVFIRIQRSGTRWEMQQKKIFVCTLSSVPW